MLLWHDRGWGLNFLLVHRLVLGSAGGGSVHFFGYLSGFVHCFTGYWITFLHVSVLDLGCSGAVFIEISGKRCLIGVPPLPPVMWLKSSMLYKSVFFII